MIFLHQNIGAASTVAPIYRREGSGKRDWWAKHPRTVPGGAGSNRRFKRQQGLLNLHLRGCPLSVGNQTPAAAYAVHLFSFLLLLQPLNSPWMDANRHLTLNGMEDWAEVKARLSPLKQSLHFFFLKKSYCCEVTLTCQAIRERSKYHNNGFRHLLWWGIFDTKHTVYKKLRLQVFNKALTSLLSIRGKKFFLHVR